MPLLFPRGKIIFEIIFSEQIWSLNFVPLNVRFSHKKIILTHLNHARILSQKNSLGNSIQSLI